MITTRQFLNPTFTLVFRRNLCTLRRCIASNVDLSIKQQTCTQDTFTPSVEQFKRFSNSAILRSDNMSEGDKKDLKVSYKDILEAQKKENVLIIDVREQFEIDETGKLPGSIHIPMADVSNMLTTLSETNFKEKYGKEKPTKETKIILSCRSGKRSGMVQEMIQAMGYKNAYNYTGGYLDWENNQKV